MPSYLDFDPEPDLNDAAPPQGAPEGGYKGSVVNDTFRYLMAVVRLLGDAVPKLGPGMEDNAKIGELALRDTVNTARIDDMAVTQTKIGAQAVTTGKIEDLAVTTAKLAASAVTHAKLDDGAVTEAKLNSQAVTSGKIADGAVTADKIASMAVSTAKIDNLAVTNAKIGAASVGSTKLTAGVLSSLVNGWVKFSTAGTIQASHNVSDVAKNAAGDFTVSWATDFASAHYAVVATVLHDGSANAPRIAHIRSQTAGSTTIQIRTGSGSVSEGGVDGVYVIACGEQ